jgi:hypothetical protein
MNVQIDFYHKITEHLVMKLEIRNLSFAKMKKLGLIPKGFKTKIKYFNSENFVLYQDLDIADAQKIFSVLCEDIDSAFYIHGIQYLNKEIQ